MLVPAVVTVQLWLSSNAYIRYHKTTKHDMQSSLYHKVWLLGAHDYYAHLTVKYISLSCIKPMVVRSITQGYKEANNI